MNADREQVRRDAAVTAKRSWPRTAHAQALLLARHCLALLAELEQAERLMREWHGRAIKAEQREAALVEALRGFREYFVQFDRERTDGRTSPAIQQIDDLLAAHEQAKR